MSQAVIDRPTKRAEAPAPNAVDAAADHLKAFIQTTGYDLRTLAAALSTLTGELKPVQGSKEEDDTKTTTILADNNEHWEYRSKFVIELGRFSIGLGPKNIRPSKHANKLASEAKREDRAARRKQRNLRPLLKGYRKLDNAVVAGDMIVYRLNDKRDALLSRQARRESRLMQPVTDTRTARAMAEVATMATRFSH